ncbi:MAG TPA: HAMP domain-containing sensor histidine kinase [Pseudonocardiaceae bacterium]|nr:HAMP domain-containing sensor histidine kinase [Pseudonocardiaceae bacterium]
MRRPLTLRGRLIAALLVFSAVGLALFGGASVLLLRHYLLSRVDQQLAHFSVHRVFETPPRVPSDYRITVFRPDGTTDLQIGQQPGQPAGPRLPTWEPGRLNNPFTVPDLAGGSGWQVRAVQLPDRRIVAIAVPLASVEATLGRLLIIECIVGGIVLALIGVVATVVVALGLRPLTRIERTAEAIAGGDLERRVPASDPRTETGRLAAALNVMLGRLATAIHERERSEQRLRQFVADASHELRTPLTSIRGFAELYRRGGARTPAEIELLTGRIEAEATRMGVLVEDLLLLARLNQERALDITDVDLLVLAADAVHDAQAREPGRPVTLTPGSDPVHVLGDEDKLRQVVSNLVTNALTHTPAGTPVRLAVRSHDASITGPPPVAQAGQLNHNTPPALGVLEVHDDGPGIPAEEATQVFDRFYRCLSGARRDRGGSGLGLAITAAILEAHNGRIELHTAARHGTTFRVLLPLA